MHEVSTTYGSWSSEDVSKIGIRIVSNHQHTFLHLLRTEIKLFSISVAPQKNKWVNQWDVTEIVIAIRLTMANGFGVCLVHCTACSFFVRADVHVELSQHGDERTALQESWRPVWMAASLISFYIEAMFGFMFRLMQCIFVGAEENMFPFHHIDNIFPFIGGHFWFHYPAESPCL